MKKFANNKIALLIITMPKFEAEAKILVKRFNDLHFDLYFPCFLASKKINLFKELKPRWKLISIDNKKSSWGEEIDFVLSQIKEKYVFLCLDDFYPYLRVSPKLLKQSLEKAIIFNPSIIRTKNNFNQRINLQHIFEHIYKETYLHRYGTSLVFPIFNRSFLKEIIRKNDTPWSFEKNSLSRFNFNNHLFLHIKNINIESVNLVVKGKILNSSIKKLPYNIQKIYLKKTIHNIMPQKVEFFYHFKRFIGRFFLKYLPYNKNNYFKVIYNFLK